MGEKIGANEDAKRSLLPTGHDPISIQPERPTERMKERNGRVIGHCRTITLAAITLFSFLRFPKWKYCCIWFNFYGRSLMKCTHVQIVEYWAMQQRVWLCLLLLLWWLLRNVVLIKTGIIIRFLLVLNYAWTARHVHKYKNSFPLLISFNCTHKKSYVMELHFLFIRF